MVYEGTQSLDYVKNFANGADQWEGFPIKVNVNPKAVMLGKVQYNKYVVCKW